MVSFFSVLRSFDHFSTGMLIDVASFGSCPAMTSSSSAASSTVCVIGPGQSHDDPIAIMPYLETRPYVGFNPTTPHHAAGKRIEPAVSVPIAAGARPAATAAADPPDDPPGTRSRLYGLLVGPKSDASVDEPCAHASRFVLPRKDAPAVCRPVTTVAS